MYKINFSQLFKFLLVKSGATLTVSTADKNFKLESLLSDKQWKDIIKVEKLRDSLMDSNFIKPSKFQRFAIPPLINQTGMVLTGQSPNGTGKTLGFLIPALLKVDPSKSDLNEKGGSSPQVIIVEQTSEVELQVKEICQNLAKEFDKNIRVSNFGHDTD